MVVFAVQFGKPTLKHLACDLPLAAGIETQAFVGDVCHEVGVTRSDWADLSRANLSGTYIKNAEKLVGERPIFQVGPVGSRCAYFVAYITDKGMRFDAGCQQQITREVFEGRLTELHGENEHAKEYRAALALIDAHAEIWAPKEDPSATEVKASAEAG